MNQDQLRAAFDAWYDDTPILKPLYFNAFLAGAQAAQQSSAPAAQPVAGQTEREAFEAWSGHAPEDGEPMAWAAWQAALSQPKQEAAATDIALAIVRGINDAKQEAQSSGVSGQLASRQEQPMDIIQAGKQWRENLFSYAHGAGEASRQEQPVLDAMKLKRYGITERYDWRDICPHPSGAYVKFADVVDAWHSHASRQEQPVPDIDGCTEEYCNRCRTPKKWRTPDMKHAGIGSYPAAPKPQEGK